MNPGAPIRPDATLTGAPHPKVKRPVRTAALPASLAMSALFAAFAVSAWAADPDASAQLKLRRLPDQPAPSEPPSAGGSPEFHCDDSYCGFAFLRDAWKRGILKPAPEPEINANTILADRARLIAEGERWAQSPPVFQVRIPGTTCALGGYSGGDGLGFGCKF